jgi:hypothetical protein
MRELALARGVYPVVALVTWEVMEKKGRKEVVEKEKVKEKGVSQVEPQKEKGNHSFLPVPNALHLVDEDKGKDPQRPLRHRHDQRRAGVQSPTVRDSRGTDCLPRESRRCRTMRTWWRRPR